MKKLLILLIGVAFTQSIQTKQVEVTIQDGGDINLYEISEAIEGNYRVSLLDYELTGITLEEIMYEIYIDRITLKSNASPNVVGIKIDFGAESFGSNMIPIEDHIGGLIMNSDYSFITQSSSGFNLPEFPEGSSLTYTFLVTGMFEDDAMFDTGDLNEDGAVNVVDVVVLVNSILGIG